MSVPFDHAADRRPHPHFTRRWLELLRAHGDPYSVQVRPDGRDEIFRGATPVVFPQPGHFDYDFRIAAMDAAGIDVFNECPDEQEDRLMTDHADWTTNLIADIRTNGRPTSGYFDGRRVMVLTTTGAKSGEPRTTIVTYTRDGDDYVVVGSNSGEPEDPAWFTNLVANPVVTVETEHLVFQARATIAEGADRDALWDRHVAEHQQFADYPSRTDRIIPIARLRPLG